MTEKYNVAHRAYVNRYRRKFIKSGLAGIGLLLLDMPRNTYALSESFLMRNKLLPPDDNGIRLSPGLKSRLIAQSGKTLPGTGFTWHDAPDGGAVFKAGDNGWIYVSNAEMPDARGSVSAIRFNKNGKIIDAYSILENTNRNCAGGATPWGTWLSCEEFKHGRVWECDPNGKTAAIPHPQLGIFSHEAAAVDPVRKHIYLTEDKKKGCLYRFNAYKVKNKRLDLSAGHLEVAELLDHKTGALKWHKIPDPSANNTPLRKQVPQSTVFKGGEGICFHQGNIYFTTKIDNRIWRYAISKNNLSILYDDDTHANPILKGVDNLAITPRGNLLIAEDGDNQQLILRTPDGNLSVVLQMHGHDKSEVTGPAFSPDGKRLYFSSQRGSSGKSSDGMTFEIEGLDL